MQPDGMADDTWSQDLAFQASIHDGAEDRRDQANLPATCEKRDDDNDRRRDICSNLGNKFTDKDNNCQKKEIGNANDKQSDGLYRAYEHSQKELATNKTAHRVINRVQEKRDVRAYRDGRMLTQPVRSSLTVQYKIDAECNHED